MEQVTVDHPKFKRIEMDFETYSHEIQESREKGRRDGVFEFLQHLEILLGELANPGILIEDKLTFEKDFFEEFDLRGPLRHFATKILDAARGIK